MSVRYVLFTVIGVGIFVASATVLILGITKLVEIGSCASGDQVYVVSRPCPEGTGGLIFAVIVASFGIFVGLTLRFLRGSPSGGRKSRVERFEESLAADGSTTSGFGGDAEGSGQFTFGAEPEQPRMGMVPIRLKKREPRSVPLEIIWHLTGLGLGILLGVLIANAVLPDVALSEETVDLPPALASSSDFADDEPHDNIDSANNYFHWPQLNLALANLDSQRDSDAKIVVLEVTATEVKATVGSGGLDLLPSEVNSAAPGRIFEVIREGRADERLALDDVESMTLARTADGDVYWTVRLVGEADPPREYFADSRGESVESGTP